MQLAKSFLSQVVLDTLSNGPIRFFAVADYGSSVGNNSVVELAEVVKAVAAQKVATPWAWPSRSFTALL